MNIDDLPLDGAVEATYKAAVVVQKSNPTKFTGIMSLPAGEKLNITYELNDVTVKTRSAVASYTMNSSYRGKGESVGINIIWKKDDKKGWVISDQEIVKNGQTISFTGLMK